MPRCAQGNAPLSSNGVRAVRHPDYGVQLIVLYKGVKAVLHMALAIALVSLAARGDIDTLREWAIQTRAHVASHWSLALAWAVAALTNECGLHVLEIGLALDAILSAVEGWCLWRGYTWGAWIVVIATAVPLPLEIRAIVTTHRVSRVLLGVVNAAVVLYLARRIARTRAASA